MIRKDRKLNTLRRVGQYLGLIYREDGTWRPGPHQATSGEANGVDAALRELKLRHESGLVTDEDFVIEKARIIDRI